MLIRAIRNFREKTRERYEAAQEENMEPWKKRVRDLHEEAAFLFILKKWNRSRTACFAFSSAASL